MRNRVNGGWRGGVGLAAAIGVVASSVLAGSAWGQTRRNQQPPASTTPPDPAAAQPSQPSRPRQQGPNPYLVRSDPKDWVLSIRVDVASSQEVLMTPTGQFPTQETWRFASAVVVFPMLPATSGWEPPEQGAFAGSLTFNDRVRVDSFEVLEGYPSGTKLAKWTLEPGEYQGKQMNLDVKVSGTGYKVQFNEQEAMKLPWPTTWPAEAMNAMKPEPYITNAPNGEDLDMAPVRDLVAKWTNGKPQSQPPVMTAKWITGQVAELVQVSGSGFGYSRTGKIQGIDSKGAPQTALDRRGSQFDVTCLLVACLREAGIPTRMVIGYDVGQKKEEQTFLKTKRGGSGRLLLILGWVA